MDGRQKPESQRRFTLMDYMAFVGGAINFIVIAYIVGYWFLR
jgi:large-conductance mechanosensitive channel